jgi:hypothetical protein
VEGGGQQGQCAQSLWEGYGVGCGCLLGGECLEEARLQAPPKGCLLRISWCLKGRRGAGGCTYPPRHTLSDAELPGQRSSPPHPTPPKNHLFLRALVLQGCMPSSPLRRGGQCAGWLRLESLCGPESTLPEQGSFPHGSRMQRHHALSLFNSVASDGKSCECSPTPNTLTFAR